MPETEQQTTPNGYNAVVDAAMQADRDALLGEAQEPLELTDDPETGSDGQGEQEPQSAAGEEADFLSDDELETLGIERDSDEHRELEKKFYPLWQKRLEEAGLTEKQIRERKRQEEEARLSQLVDERIGKSKETRDEPESDDDDVALDWSTFEPRVPLQDVLGSDEDAQLVREAIREEISHLVERAELRGQRLREREARQEAQAKVQSWIEKVQKHPDLDADKGALVMKLVRTQGMRQMLAEDPAEALAILEARTGLSTEWEERPAKKVAPAGRPAPRARQAVPRSSGASPSGQREIKPNGYKDAIEDAFAKHFG